MLYSNYSARITSGLMKKVRCSNILSVAYFNRSQILSKITPKNLKKKSRSSQQWLIRQMNDPYVKRAHEESYRARSAFKILEIDDKLRIFKPGQVVVECGAAPGAWSQVIVKRVNGNGLNPKVPTGLVIGIDLLPIEPLEGARFFSPKDFTDPQVQKGIMDVVNSIGFCHVNVLVSDMAPNSSGDHATDHFRIIKLAQQASNFILKHGAPGSHFLTKVWDGSETQVLIDHLKQYFQHVGKIKPASSRKDSSEIFLFAKNYCNIIND